MTTEVLFKHSYAFTTTTVYADRIELQYVFSKKMIPMRQVASVDLLMPMLAKVQVETTGGKRYDVLMWPTAKTEFRDVVTEAIINLI